MIRHNMMVKIESSQTQRKAGEVVRIEEDYNWGNQYLVKTYHPDWGYECFWFREHEIRSK